MSSGLKIRIPARRSTLVNSGASSSNQPLNNTEDSKPQSEMEDVEMEENTESLPGRKYTARSGNLRNPPERWVQWETDFLERCFETTRYPDLSLRSEWALSLTEKRLKNIKSSSEDKENLAKIWHSHYKRRLSNWFKNRKARLRREGEVLMEEIPAGLDEESPITSHRVHKKIRNHSVVQKYTVTKNHRYCEEDDEEEFRDDSPESEEGQSELDELKDDIPRPTCSADDEVLQNGSRLDILAHLASLQPPLPVTTSACRDEPMSESQPRAPWTLPASTSQNEFLAKYDDDVIYGATLLMQLKMGYKG